jgi:hypothetical protein
MATKYRVVQVKGAKPETFIVVGIDFDAGAITSTSESMHEAEMRVICRRQAHRTKRLRRGLDRHGSIRSERDKVPGNKVPGAHGIQRTESTEFQRSKLQGERPGHRRSKLQGQCPGHRFAKDKPLNG